MIVCLGILPSAYVLIFKPENREMPYYPIEQLNTNSTPIFMVAYFTEIIEGTFGPTVIFAVDFSIMSIIAQLSAQLRLLQFSLK